MFKRLVLNIYIVLGFWTLSTAQVVDQVSDEWEHSVYFLSNLEKLDLSDTLLTLMEQQLETINRPHTLVFNGDFLSEDGYSGMSASDHKAKVDRLLSLRSEQGTIYFVPGDREWDDNGFYGLEKVKALEDYLEGLLGKGKGLLPEKGCPGPEVVDIGTGLRLIFINTQWFNHTYQRPEEESTKCPELNEEGFWVELDDAIEDAENRNVVIVGHHPSVSYGKYAGYKLSSSQAFPPLIGPYIAGYHQNVGNAKDLANAGLKSFGSQLKHRLSFQHSLVYVSGHEYDIQINRVEDNYYINSGAFVKSKGTAKGRHTLYKQSRRGMVRMDFNKNGAVRTNVYKYSKKKGLYLTDQRTLFQSACVEELEEKIPINTQCIPCLKKIQADGLASKIDLPKYGSAAAGPRYKSGLFRRLLLGKHYRKTWYTPLDKVPMLDIGTVAGGLIPHQRGGGAQTTSLKFNTEEGNRYAFRVLDKDPTKKKNRDLVTGVYGSILQDLTSSQHPYGPLVVTNLMDALGLAHSNPQLFIMPDDPRLGVFNEEFKGTMGWLEIKPRGKNKGSDFKEADKVVSTLKMYEKLLDDNDNKVDLDAYLQSRLLDMLIADWDRHHRNYKWLAYKKNKSYTYVPFPKDWDKAFTRMQGLFRVMDMEVVTRDMARFTDSFKGPKSLNFKSRNQDRWLTASLTLDDWLKATQQFTTTVTNDLIDQSVNLLPENVRPLSADFLSETLRYRRDHLEAAVRDYYLLLAKYVDIVGCNTKEIFEVDRLANGHVQVKVFKKAKKKKTPRLFFERTFDPKETKEIRLYGLGKDDVFRLKGESKSSILVRIIGGKGEDKIVDESKVSGTSKLTRVYDFERKDTLQLNSEGKWKKTPKPINFESRKFFNYNYGLVLPLLTFNADDGIGLNLRANFTKQKFNKPGFGSKYDLRFAITSKGNYSLLANYQERHVLKLWDFVADVEARFPDNTVDNFYRLGNETILDRDLRGQAFYENETTSFNIRGGFKNTFWQKSIFQSQLYYEFRDVDPNPDRETLTSVYDELTDADGIGEETFIGIRNELNIDFRNSNFFPTRGNQFKLINHNFYRLDNKKLGGRLDASSAVFYTAGIKIPTTLSMRIGYIQSYGSTPFYYKSFLGQQSNLRGYLRNRFAGNSAVYFNNDLRFHFGKIFTPLVPVRYGIFGLFDAGRVWAPGEDSHEWHLAYGGGFYFIPHSDALNINLTFARSDEEDLLFTFGLGFFLK